MRRPARRHEPVIRTHFRNLPLRVGRRNHASGNPNPNPDGGRGPSSLPFPLLPSYSYISPNIRQFPHKIVWRRATPPPRSTKTRGARNARSAARATECSYTRSSARKATSGRSAQDSPAPRPTSLSSSCAVGRYRETCHRHPPHPPLLLLLHHLLPLTRRLHRHQRATSDTRA